MKFCKDCVFIRDAHRQTFEKCAKLPTGPDPVSGEPGLTYCSTAREARGGCGPDADLFVQKVVVLDDPTVEQLDALAERATLARSAISKAMR